MTLVDMGLQIIFVSVSGVISPGPLFFANLVLSKSGGFWSGIKIAIGHSIVELPVIILYSIPLIVLSSPDVTSSIIKFISFIGGISLIAFGILYVVKTVCKIITVIILSSHLGFKSRFLLESYSQALTHFSFFGGLLWG
jgi:threonine/homoserine/homoserine lactone efflux protein